jgi:hypothetical protein
MPEAPTTVVIQRYLYALPVDAAAEPIIRELLERSAHVQEIGPVKYVRLRAPVRPTELSWCRGVRLFGHIDRGLVCLLRDYAI